MKQQIWDFASYNLLSLFSPPVGREHWHCHMKRGFTKARKREPEVKRLLEQDNTAQRIGILAQRGVYEFHHHPLTLHRGDVVEEIAEILHLNEESVEVQQRVIEILKNYQDKPLLLGKKSFSSTEEMKDFQNPSPWSMEIIALTYMQQLTAFLKSLMERFIYWISRLAHLTSMYVRDTFTCWLLVIFIPRERLLLPSITWKLGNNRNLFRQAMLHLNLIRLNWRE